MNTNLNAYVLYLQELCRRVFLEALLHALAVVEYYVGKESERGLLSTFPRKHLAYFYKRVYSKRFFQLFNPFFSI